MKKVYIKPFVEIERYELNESIANNCGIVVDNGPELGTHKQCEKYEDPYDTSQVAVAAVYNVLFYEDTNCDCYYSAVDSGYWTS